MKYSVVIALIATLLIPSVVKGQEIENEQNWSLGKNHQRMNVGISAFIPNVNSSNIFEPFSILPAVPGYGIYNHRGPVIPGVYLGLKFFNGLINGTHPLYFQSGCDINLNYYKGSFESAFLSVALPLNLVYDIRVSKKYYLELAAGATIRCNLEGKYDALKFYIGKNEDRLRWGYNASWGLVSRKGTISYQMNLDFRDYFDGTKKILPYHIISYGFPLY